MFESLKVPCSVLWVPCFVFSVPRLKSLLFEKVDVKGSWFFNLLSLVFSLGSWFLVLGSWFLFLKSLYFALFLYIS